jgi:hypothetical protein
MRYMKNLLAVIGVAALAYLTAGTVVIANEIRNKPEEFENATGEELIGGILIWPFFLGDKASESDF